MASPRHSILLLQTLIAALSLSGITAKHYKCQQIIDEGKTMQVCKEICPDDCPNGACNINIEQCVCLFGSHMEDNKCMRDCHAGCPEHAECITGSNNCRCKTGYRSAEDGKCVPSCNPDCGENKHCAAPDACLCNEGYLTTKTGCEPICQKCYGEHARCVAPNKCECVEGYKEGGISNGIMQCLPVCEMASPQCANDN